MNMNHGLETDLETVCQMFIERIFFVGTGLPTGEIKLNPLRFAETLDSKVVYCKFDIRSYTYVTNTRKYIGLFCYDFYIFSKSVLKRVQKSVLIRTIRTMSHV